MSFDEGMDDWPEEWMFLNREAQLALSLARSDIIAPIVALLRSDAPIHPIVRQSIADAFEGMRPGGAPQFVVRKTGRGDYSGKSLGKFRRDIEIARFVAERLKVHPRDKAGALKAAASKFLMSEKLCDAAVTKGSKMDTWLKNNFTDAERTDAFAQMADDDWQSFREAHYWARILRKGEK